MNRLPLYCLCVMVWAWSVPCLEPAGTVVKCGDGRCVCNTTHANCRLKSLHYIPKFPPGVTSLDFSHNKPRNTERADFFDNITDVVWLDFSNNSHSYLNFSSSTFGCLTNLTSLDLRSSVMPCHSLSAVLQIPSLKVLRLTLYTSVCEDLASVDISAPIPRLRDLDLSVVGVYPYVNLSCLLPFTGLRRLIIHGVGCYICELPENVSLMLSALHTLKLTYIDMSFSSLSCESVAILLATPSLREIRLRKGTDCEKFDFTLGDKRMNLVSLDLSENKISEISNFSLPAGLKHLDVSHNRIRSVIFLLGLPHLKVLEMRGNGLEYARLLCNPSLQQLDLSDNELGVISLMSTYPSCLPNLTTLNLHANKYQTLSLYRLLVKFGYFHNLEVLDLSGQGISKAWYVLRNSSRVRNVRLTSLNLADNNIAFDDDDSIPIETFRGYPKLARLTLDKNDLSAVSEERFLQLFGHLVHLQQLSLRSTGLRFIPPAISRSFRELISIDLSHNKLSAVPTAVPRLKHLAALNLTSNMISIVHEFIFSFDIRRQLQHVDLSDNPFTCSCDVLWFRRWLLASPSVFAHSSSDYLCANLPDTPIMSFSMTEQACLLSQETSRFIIATVSLIFLSLTSLTFVYRYRWHIRLVLHEVFRAPEDRLRRLRQHRFEYDVFVCYDSEDFPWVRDHLIPRLEEGMGLKLCLHYRDFIPGTPIMDNIQDSVVASKKMLMLFSRQFARSPWCQFELRLCLTHALDTQDVLVVVLLDDIPSRELTSAMMAVMKTTTYIEWADEDEARDSFWRRMRLALHEVLPGARV